MDRSSWSGALSDEAEELLKLAGLFCSNKVAKLARLKALLLVFPALHFNLEVIVQSLQDCPINDKDRQSLPFESLIRYGSVLICQLIRGGQVNHGEVDQFMKLVDTLAKDSSVAEQFSQALAEATIQGWWPLLTGLDLSRLKRNLENYVIAPLKALEDQFMGHGQSIKIIQRAVSNSVLSMTISSLEMINLEAVCTDAQCCEASFNLFLKMRQLQETCGQSCHVQTRTYFVYHSDRAGNIILIQNGNPDQ